MAGTAWWCMSAAVWPCHAMTPATLTENVVTRLPVRHGRTTRPWMEPAGLIRVAGGRVRQLGASPRAVPPPAAHLVDGGDRLLPLGGSGLLAMASSPAICPTSAVLPAIGYPPSPDTISSQSVTRIHDGWDGMSPSLHCPGNPPIERSAEPPGLIRLDV